MSYRDELIQVAAVAVAAIEDYDNSGYGADLTGTQSVLAEVAVERQRQNVKFGARENTPYRWLVILGEEYGEVCKDVLEDNY